MSQSAERTSSSLKGLMMAVINFMNDSPFVVLVEVAYRTCLHRKHSCAYKETKVHLRKSTFHAKELFVYNQHVAITRIFSMHIHEAIAENGAPTT
jgi:hypothetical protein